MNPYREPFAIPELLEVKIMGFRIDVETSMHIFEFSNAGKISTGGLWRLLVDGRIVATKADIGLQDWRPNSVSLEEQARAHMSQYLFGNPITSATVSVPTGDLRLVIGHNIMLEIIKEHSFLECWEIVSEKMYLLVDAWGNVNKW